MTEDTEDAIPDSQLPRQEELDYDLARVLRGVVSLRTHVPEDGFTAGILGTERYGHGALIDGSGLVLTIGYLIAEAEEAWVFDGTGRAVAGDVVAYDYETGFGLVRALGRVDGTALELGASADLRVGDPVVLAARGGRRHALRAKVTALREFAGYWEYLIDRAVYTSPVHPDWGGTALLDARGRLCGIGSLHLENLAGQEPPRAGNLSVPVDLLVPVLDELIRYGRTLKPPRPWLGVFIAQGPDALVVGGAYPGGPAAALLQEGDVILALGGTPVRELGAFYRMLWALGAAGVDVPLTIGRERKVLEVRVRSMDRRDAWKKPRLH